MTSEQMVASLEAIYGRTLEDVQQRIYRRKLEHFSEEQRVQIFDRVLEKSRFFPKIADLFEVARELRLPAQPAPEAVESRGPECRLCRGEGRLAVFMLFEGRRSRQGPVRPERRLRRIFPYSSGDASDYAAQADPREYMYVFRCGCPSGSSPALPGHWPVWRDSESEGWSGQAGSRSRGKGRAGLSPLPADAPAQGGRRAG